MTLILFGSGSKSDTVILPYQSYKAFTACSREIIGNNNLNTLCLHHYVKDSPSSLGHFHFNPEKQICGAQNRYSYYHSVIPLIYWIICHKVHSSKWLAKWPELLGHHVNLHKNLKSFNDETLNLSHYPSPQFCNDELMLLQACRLMFTVMIQHFGNSRLLSQLQLFFFLNKIHKFWIDISPSC